MRKPLTFLSLVFLPCLFVPVFAVGPHAASTPTAAAMAPQNEEITLDKLNSAKIGVYKSYQDFLKGRCEPLVFDRWHYLYTGSTHLKYLKAVFRDANDKKVTLDCNEFWGFKCSEGLYKTFPFSTGDVNSICFLLSFQYQDYCIWYALSNDQIHFTPGMLYTKGVNGEGTIGPKEKSEELYAKLGIDCRIKSLVNGQHGDTDWDASIKNMKQCTGMKFVNVLKSKGKEGANYFGVQKKGIPDVWKYAAITP